MRRTRIAKATKLMLAGLLAFCWAAAAFAQARDVAEPAAILEVGGAASQSLSGGGPSGGPGLAVEVTPIEKWLEVEAGVTPLFGRRSTEWDVDLLFKKPWDLSEKVELMAGVGPEWIHTRAGGTSKNAIGAEAALDFMFWPSSSRRFGWYLEPSYDLSFAGGHEQSIGITGGLLIRIGRKRRAGR